MPMLFSCSDAKIHDNLNFQKKLSFMLVFFLVSVSFRTISYLPNDQKIKNKKNRPFIKTVLRLPFKKQLLKVIYST